MSKDDEKDPKFELNDDGSDRTDPPSDDPEFHDDDEDEEGAFMAMGDMVVILSMQDAKISISVPSDMGVKTVERLFDAAVEALGKVRVQIN